MQFNQSQRKQKDEKHTWILPESWKMLWNMKVTFIPIILSELVTVLKDLETVDIGNQRKTRGYTDPLKYWKMTRWHEQTCCQVRMGLKVKKNRVISYYTWLQNCNLTTRLLFSVFLLDIPLGNNYFSGGARGIMVIVVGNGHGDTSSNPRRGWLHFTLH